MQMNAASPQSNAIFWASADNSSNPGLSQGSDSSKLGLGTASWTRIQTDPTGQLDATALETALAKNANVPTIVILQAGDLNVGAFDPFETPIPVAKRHNAWVHVDGAFGLWAQASSRHRHLLAGVSAADSWATDGHKWLNVPFDCGYAFVADSEAHAAAMSHRVSYISYSANARAEERNPDYAARLQQTLRDLDFPIEYVNSVTDR